MTSINDRKRKIIREILNEDKVNEPSFVIQRVKNDLMKCSVVGLHSLRLVLDDAKSIPAIFNTKFEPTVYTVVSRSPGENEIHYRNDGFDLAGGESWEVEGEYVSYARIDEKGTSIFHVDESGYAFMPLYCYQADPTGTVGYWSGTWADIDMSNVSHLQGRDWLAAMPAEVNTSTLPFLYEGALPGFDRQ